MYTDVNQGVMFFDGHHANAFHREEPSRLRPRQKALLIDMDNEWVITLPE